LQITVIVLLLVMNILLIGETLYFGVSPFDATFKLSAKYDFSFWQFRTLFNIDIPLSQRFAVPHIKPDFSNVFEYFEFISEPYKVTYTDLNKEIPFTTFVNPAQKCWYVTWLNTGYFGEGLIHKDDYLSIISSKYKVNLSFKINGLNIFAEHSDNGFNLGFGNGIYLFMGEKTGFGVLYNFEKTLIYVLVFYSNNQFHLKNGFTMKDNNFEINIVNDEIDGQMNVSGRIQWKVGDMYVVGRLQGKEVRIYFEFPIW